jgi:hypothetical protein
MWPCLENRKGSIEGPVWLLLMLGFAEAYAPLMGIGCHALDLKWGR